MTSPVGCYLARRRRPERIRNRESHHDSISQLLGEELRDGNPRQRHYRMTRLHFASGRVLEVFEAPASWILRHSERMGNRGPQSATARKSLTSISSTSAGMTASRSATTVAFASLIVRRTPFASASGP